MHNYIGKFLYLTLKLQLRLLDVLTYNDCIAWPVMRIISLSLQKNTGDGPTKQQQGHPRKEKLNMRETEYDKRVPLCPLLFNHASYAVLLHHVKTAFWCHKHACKVHRRGWIHTGDTLPHTGFGSNNAYLTLPPRLCLVQHLTCL